MGKGIICKDDNKFFTLLEKGIVNKDKPAMGKCITALQAFMNKPQIIHAK